MKIRKAEVNDLNEIMMIYAYARKRMKENGNPTQWGEDYPQTALIAEDIQLGQCFVGVDENDNIHLVFAFIIGEDPTYALIEEGNWLDDELYGTIHRLASDGTYKGSFSKCMQFCTEKINNLRADTHHDNKIMQHLLIKNGFKQCGIIYVKDGSKRLAYHKSKGM